MKRFTTNEAASELGVTPSRVRQMILEGKLKAKKIGRDLLISEKALAGAKKRKIKPGPAPKGKK
jgi:excisionase family DNA binding protein